MDPRKKGKNLKDIDSEDNAVLYSNNLLKAFEAKAKEFNEVSDRKVTTNQIKSIYISLRYRE